MTSKYLQIKQKMQSLVDYYYQAVKQSEKKWNDDNEKATIIQAKFRMFRLFKHYQKNRAAAISIQKATRAYLATHKFLLLKRMRTNIYNTRYFDNQATVIQRYYRGYIKRKYYHDFYARKQYLTFLKVKNNDFKQLYDNQAIKEKEEEIIRNEQCAKEEFHKLAMNLHHLSSTFCQPGIYKPPFAKEPPKAFKIEVETHLKAIFKTQYQNRPPRKLQSAVQSNSKERFRIRPSTQNSRRQ